MLTPRAQALIVEADIRASGIALSEVEYIALLEGFTRSPKCDNLAHPSLTLDLTSDPQRVCSAGTAAPHER